MENNFDYIKENLEIIRENIGSACAKYRSSDENVRIMAVTKTVAPEAVNFAVLNGIGLLGENRVQEFRDKKDFYEKSAEVHFIGHLQTNKIKYIISEVSMIQSVDSIKLAEEINRLSEKNGRVTDILCEINIGGEESKSGVSPEQLDELLFRTAEMKNLHVCGLMTIPPPTKSDIYLARMQELFMKCRERETDGAEMKVLSMGMTHDYCDAVKYGSTLVRIGTGLFGARNYK